MDPEKLDLKAENIDEKGKQPTYDLLKIDDDKELEKVEPKGDKKEVIDLEDDVDDGKKSKEDKEEKEIDDAELQIKIPRNKEILEKYPNLFKEFPHLKTAAIKLQKFYEQFPSIEAAESTVKELNDFKEFEKEIISGNLESTLKQVHDNDKDAFGRIVDNYLPNLQKVNSDAYYHVIGGIIKGTIVAMVQDAKENNLEDLQTAATILHKYVFKSNDWKPHTKFGPGDTKPDEKQQKFDEERNSYLQQRFDDAKNDLSGRVSNIIESTINEYIDPRSQMTDYVKRNAIRQVKEDLDKIIEGDAQFKKILDSAWERAGTENFSRNALDKIKGAWLSKARAHLKDLITKARKDALEGLGKRVRSEEKQVHEEKRERSAPNRSRDDEPKKNMKTVDYFMQDD